MALIHSCQFNPDSDRFLVNPNHIFCEACWTTGMDQRGRQKSVSQPSNPAQENFSNDSILKIRVKVGLASVAISKI